jgi:hypothetical protein
MSIDQKIKKLEKKLKEEVGEDKLNKKLESSKNSINVDEFLKKATELDEYSDGTKHNHLDC